MTAYRPRWIQQTFAVAKVVALETLEHPVTVLLLLVSSVGTLLLPLFQFQRFTEDGRLARDCGLATAFLFGFFLMAGSAGRLYRALRDGTAATAWVKPLTRTQWWLGYAWGLSGVLVLYLVTQGAATLLAEACGPHYHALGTYAEMLPRVFTLCLFPVGALVGAAALHRFANRRFVLSANLLMCLLLLGCLPFFNGIHWGSATALLPIGMALVQVMSLALASAVIAPAGVTLALSLIVTALGILFCHGAAYLPFDAVAQGGAVAWKTLALLLPQTLSVALFATWCGTRLLKQRELA